MVIFTQAFIVVTHIYSQFLGKMMVIICLPKNRHNNNAGNLPN